MNKVTTEQAEIILIAVNKIASAMVMMSVQKSKTDYWADVAEQALQSLRDIGVPLESL